MNKLSLTFLILFLIFSTAIIKNSTKRINDEIFTLEESIRVLNKDLSDEKLEFEYLSSAEKLLEFQNQYFEDELKKKDIKEIKILKKKFNKFETKSLTIDNE